jgi:hypothetical protein
LNEESGAVISKSQRIKIVCSSSCEAELRAIHEGIKDVIWLKYLLLELGFEHEPIVDVYTDSESAISIIKSSANSDKTRHIAMDINALREFYDNSNKLFGENKWMNLIYVDTTKNVADILN